MEWSGGSHGIDSQCLGAQVGGNGLKVQILNLAYLAYGLKDITDYYLQNVVEKQHQLDTSNLFSASQGHWQLEVQLIIQAIAIDVVFSCLQQANMTSHLSSVSVWPSQWPTEQHKCNKIKILIFLVQQKYNYIKWLCSIQIIFCDWDKEFAAVYFNIAATWNILKTKIDEGVKSLFPRLQGFVIRSGKDH